jgi:hypothetical protein
VEAEQVGIEGEVGRAQLREDAALHVVGTWDWLLGTSSERPLERVCHS